MSSKIRKGSDPLIQTARGKLQSRRSKLNDQINLELRLRAGAENLYKATTNKKLRETVALELSYVNSTLQLLKEELADLNSSVQVYQSHSLTQCAPMIPLGLKETKDVNFEQPFTEMIERHYSEDTAKFTKQISHITEMRQACRTPVRNNEGICLMYEYYNQLYFVDRRFFPPGKPLYFEWFDSLTGVPNAQRTVGFEKGSILFNIGALHTQIGARQDRSVESGICQAMEQFQLAAGALQFLNDNFSNAPSTDMQEDTLNMLVQLMLAQAQECAFERRVLGDMASDSRTHVDTAHEAAQVYNMYRRTRELMLFDHTKPNIPPSWISMVSVKGEYFRALSHYHASLALLHDNTDNNNSENNNTTKTSGTGGTDPDTSFDHLHQKDAASRKMMESCGLHLPPRDEHEKKLLAKAHLREAILSHEEALRVHGLSRQLRKIDAFHDILKLSHDQSLQMYAELEEEDDFTELLTVPNVQARASLHASVTAPDFVRYKVEDVFSALGPLAIFSARHQWSPPRSVDMSKGPGQEYGFSVRGDSPVIIAAVETNSLAHKNGLRVGDFIVGVGNKDIKWSQHEDVVAQIRNAGNHLPIRIITPVDRNYLEPTSYNSQSQPRSHHHRGQRSNSQGHLVDVMVGKGGHKSRSQTLAAAGKGRPSSASSAGSGMISSSSSRRFSIGEGTLKKNKNNSVKSDGGKGKMSGWTLRRNRSKSRENTLQVLAIAGR